MSAGEARLAALIGSRICHDIISPIGAIGNGLELMELSGLPASPETELIQQSCESAQARIAFFRIGYGAAGDEQSVSPREASDILASLSASGGRQRFLWRVSEDMKRSEVQLAFLAVQIMETALPGGGTVSIRFESGRWRLSVDEGTAQVEGDLWAALERGETPESARPEHVQFMLLPRLLEGTGRKVQLVREGKVTALIV